MGARSNGGSAKAIIQGVPSLHGEEVRATDLRAAACLVLAGLFGQGETVLHHVELLGRGFVCLGGKAARWASAGQLPAFSFVVKPYYLVSEYDPKRRPSQIIKLCSMDTLMFGFGYSSRCR